MKIYGEYIFPRLNKIDWSKKILHIFLGGVLPDTDVSNAESSEVIRYLTE